MQVEQKTDKGVVLFVKVPDDASDLTCPKIGIIDLYFQTKVQSKHEEDNYISISLPDVGFEYIGLTSDVTELQSMNMLDYQSDNDEHQSPIFKDYVKGKYHLEPIQSFKSLMQKLQVYEVNPYGDCRPKYFDYSSQIQYEGDCKDFDTAEERTGSWLVLFKPNEKN